MAGGGLYPYVNIGMAAMQIIDSSENIDFYYVYELRRPSNGVIFYVGAGSGDRIDAHERDAKNNNVKMNKMVKGIILKEGGTIIKEKVAENLSFEQAYVLETKLIARYGRKCKGTGPLANIMPGGYAASPEQIAKFKSRKRAPFSEETRRKISESHKGMTYGEETRAKIRASRVGFVFTKEVLAKMSAASTGRRPNAERNAEIKIELDAGANVESLAVKYGMAKNSMHKVIRRILKDEAAAKGEIVNFKKIANKKNGDRFRGKKHNPERDAHIFDLALTYMSGAEIARHLGLPSHMITDALRRSDRPRILDEMRVKRDVIIFQAHNNGMSFKDISLTYRVSLPSVSRIIRAQKLITVDLKLAA
jgi:Mor family transcriptional regulator